MKKLIVFDWDDTLYDSQNQTLPEYQIQVLKELKEKEDVLIGIASGRAAFYFKNFDIDWDVYVTNNGQYVKVFDKVLFENKVDPGIRKQLEDWVEEKNGTLFGVHSVLGIFRGSEPKDPNIVDHISYKRIENYGPHQANLPYEHILLLAYDSKYDQELKNLVPQYIIHRYHGYMVDVIPKGITKLEAVLKAADYLNISKENIIAFGDSHNDIEMLEGVGVGIAMGNANVEVKEKAKMITDDFNQEGIRKALEKLNILIKEK